MYTSVLFFFLLFPHETETRGVLHIYTRNTLLEIDIPARFHRSTNRCLVGPNNSRWLLFQFRTNQKLDYRFRLVFVAHEPLVCLNSGTYCLVIFVTVHFEALIFSAVWYLVQSNSNGSCRLSSMDVVRGILAHVFFCSKRELKLGIHCADACLTLTSQFLIMIIG